MRPARLAHRGRPPPRPPRPSQRMRVCAPRVHGGRRHALPPTPTTTITRPRAGRGCASADPGGGRWPAGDHPLIVSQLEYMYCMYIFRWTGTHVGEGGEEHLYICMYILHICTVRQEGGVGLSVRSNKVPSSAHWAVVGWGRGGRAARRCRGLARPERRGRPRILHCHGASFSRCEQSRLERGWLACRRGGPLHADCWRFEWSRVGHCVCLETLTAFLSRVGSSALLFSKKRGVFKACRSYCRTGPPLPFVSTCRGSLSLAPCLSVSQGMPPATDSPIK